MEIDLSVEGELDERSSVVHVGILQVGIASWYCKLVLQVGILQVGMLQGGRNCGRWCVHVPLSGRTRGGPLVTM
jgi:hypothetical protein